MDFVIDCALGAVAFSVFFAGYAAFCFLFGRAGNRFPLKD